MIFLFDFSKRGRLSIQFNIYVQTADWILPLVKVVRKIADYFEEGCMVRYYCGEAEDRNDGMPFLLEKENLPRGVIVPGYHRQ